MNLGENFLEAISTIVDAKVQGALCEYMMAKLSEAFKKETDKATKKNLSNYKSAVSMLQEFVAQDDASEVESVESETSSYKSSVSMPSELVAKDDDLEVESGVPKTSSFTIALPCESVYTREELLKKFHSRLSTQDRFYSDACFPARLITKINARKHELYKKISLNTRFLIAEDSNQYMLLSDIDRLVIRTDGYVKIEGKGKVHDVYTAVYNKGRFMKYERLCVDSVALISLDHIRPVHSELLSFLATHSVYSKFSESVNKHKSEHAGMKVPALAADYFGKEYPGLGLAENILLDEICAFINSLQLVALHRSYNSSKSDNV